MWLQLKAIEKNPTKSKLQQLYTTRSTGKYCRCTCCVFPIGSKVKQNKSLNYYYRVQLTILLRIMPFVILVKLFFFSQSSSGQVKWIVKPSSGLLFPAVDYMRQKIIAELSPLDRASKPSVIIVDCTHFDKTDFTAAQVCTILTF